MRCSRRAFAAALFALALSCRRDGSLLVFAASSTVDALSEIGALWQAHGRGSVRFSFGASGDLARQIGGGAPADVFLSADVARVNELEQAGLVSVRRDLLSNRLVVLVPRDAPALASVTELVARKRIAIADPETAPVGAYAREWLQRERAWDLAQPKIVPVLDARAAVVSVENGAVDAAIVYATDARAAKSARVAFEPKDPPRIVYPAAALVRGGARARAFLDFLASDEARAVFVRHGFLATT